MNGMTVLRALSFVALTAAGEMSLDVRKTSVIHVKVISPRFESPAPITPPVFDRRTRLQPPTVIDNPVQVARCRDGLAQVRFAPLSGQRDIRYWLEFRSVTGEPYLHVHASPRGEIVMDAVAWEPSNPHWITNCIGGLTVPSDHQRRVEPKAAPEPRVLSESRALSYAIAAAAVGSGCIAWLWIRGRRRSRLPRRADGE